jgi:DNA recombination protein RmuC
MLIALAIISATTVLLAVVWQIHDARTSRFALQSQIQGLDARLSAGVTGVQQSLSTSLSGAQQTMQSVGQQLGELSESSRRMLEIGRDISGLQEMFRAPKPRGQFGELLLERMLADLLPREHYAIQHRFRNGTVVDAIVRMAGGIVPIDSKFPDAAFRRMLAAPDDGARAGARRDFVRDVRSHIDAVSKYILPDEGTFGFAMMYIPAENIYYEAMIRDAAGDLQSYAHDRRVVACSPNTFVGFLEAIVMGLQGLRVEERAREILGHLRRLDSDFGRFRRDFETLGNHLSHARSKYDEIDREGARIADRIVAPLRDGWGEDRPRDIVEAAPRLIP